MTSVTLSSSQVAALEHVARLARARRELARAALDEVCAMSNIAAGDLERAAKAIRQHARVALHFHPDRPDDQHRTVAEDLLAGGVYKSQFETQLQELKLLWHVLVRQGRAHAEE